MMICVAMAPITDEVASVSHTVGFKGLPYSAVELSTLGIMIPVSAGTHWK